MSTLYSDNTSRLLKAPKPPDLVHTANYRNIGITLLSRKVCKLTLPRFLTQNAAASRAYQSHGVGAGCNSVSSSGEASKARNGHLLPSRLFNQ